MIKKIYSGILLLGIMVTIGFAGYTQKTNAQTPPECANITSGDKIPASCEGNDVKVSGTKINMNKIKVFQKSVAGSYNKGQVCGEINIADCDSKRHFKNLVVTNGAELTYEPITASDMAQDTDLDNSLADEIEGSARWKKVDIIVDENLQLGTNAKIIANENGYPGGKATGGSDRDSCLVPYGPGKGFYRHHVATDQDANYMGDGAGFGGFGGLGTLAYKTSAYWGNPVRGSGYTWIQKGLKYNPKMTNPSDKATSLEWGSGGSCLANWTSGEDTNINDGGNGGGAIRLIVGQTLIFNDKNTSKIEANGQASRNIKTDSAVGGGGGGSGGFILIKAANISNPADNDKVTANKAVNGTTNGQENGIIEGMDLFTDPGSNVTTAPIHANGGDGFGGVGAGGAGGRIIFIKSDVTSPPPPPPCTTPPDKIIHSRNIEVIVSWDERGKPTQHTTLNTVLRNMVESPVCLPTP